MNIPMPDTTTKQIGEIVFRKQDELGFWGQRGYSNPDEPWF